MCEFVSQWQCTISAVSNRWKEVAQTFLQDCWKTQALQTNEWMVMGPGSSIVAQEQSTKVFNVKVQSFWSKKKKCEHHFDLHFLYKKNCLLQIYFSKTVDEASCLQVLNVYSSERPCLWLHKWICIMIACLSFFACWLKQCLFKRNYQCWNIHCTLFGLVWLLEFPELKVCLMGFHFEDLKISRSLWWQYWKNFWTSCMETKLWNVYMKSESEYFENDHTLLMINDYRCSYRTLSPCVSWLPNIVTCKYRLSSQNTLILTLTWLYLSGLWF
jgi:hypothetical protein